MGATFFLNIEGEMGKDIIRSEVFAKKLELKISCGFRRETVNNCSAT
jgi:hypothetical protein